jgi:ATPase subunit of ABC transporter with duplicated ATPase domains
MIPFSSISKQCGPQVLSRNAGFRILPGSRSGLVGHNGAGKTGIFRLIMDEEAFDSGGIVSRSAPCSSAHEMGSVLGLRERGIWTRGEHCCRFNRWRALC